MKCNAKTTTRLKRTNLAGPKLLVITEFECNSNLRTKQMYFTLRSIKNMCILVGLLAKKGQQQMA
jgi:hypothetical protein